MNKDVYDRILDNIGAGNSAPRLPMSTRKAISFSMYELRTLRARVTALEAELKALKDAAAPAKVPDVLPASRLIRVDTVSNTVRIEYLDKVGRETLSELIPFDGTIPGLLMALAAAKGEA
jgi:hypothetical protein